ncbi:MAG: hypothetical protein WCB03_02290 [Rouxiella badensis]|jgi:hypothetical protein|uniref:Phage tail protein n=1 Tax=Rouxiella badensis TaxID=1646377 RepID=A0A1X0WAG1_9GAMM|nr:hypothetical protein [Rouxiella badensis]ORJ23759.1 hypothetical protein BS640_19675 [Rouxiella badensis]QOI54798.1 hypothetical protein H2866_18000 [Rouxiella badensis subsp. acadiensis]
MPQNGYTLGRDIAVDIVTAYGTLRIPQVISFDAKPKVNSLEITPLNGLTDELLIPKNWGGTIEAERQDATLDAWWAQWEADYYSGVNRAAGTITETIEEVNGSVSVWRYTNVQIHFTDPGKKSGDQTVRQSMTFTAQRRIRVS